MMARIRRTRKGFRLLDGGFLALGAFELGELAQQLALEVTHFGVLWLACFFVVDNIKADVKSLEYVARRPMAQGGDGSPSLWLLAWV